jgi:ribose transport system permease protein rbsC
MNVDNRKIWLIARKYATLFILVIFLIAMAFLSDRFFTFKNLTNVGRQISLNAILALGMTLVIISGGIDLSVGGVCALGCCVCAKILNSTGSSLLAIAVVLLIGLAVGAFNGFVVSKTGIAPFIVTLSTVSIIRGITLVMTNASPMPISNAAFKFIGQGTLLGIPFPIYITLILAIITAFVMNKTVFGRYVYAIGGNERSAVVAGIQVKKVKISVYMVSGFLAAFTAIIYTSRLSSGVPSLGNGFEMDAITAAVIGGASLAGGQGHIWGTMIGAVIIGILNNALNLLNINSYFQDIVKGIVVLLAVLFDFFIQSRIVSKDRA